MTGEATSEGRVQELQAAFQAFTTATATLERQYRLLQEQVRALRRELEEKRHALAASIERQRCLESQALRQSRLAAMGEMAATLAHEVRNPLGAMQLFARLLAEEIADRPSALRLVDHVTAGIADLDHLVTNILDYTRLPDPRRVASVLDEVIDQALLAATAYLGTEVRVERRRAPATEWAVDPGLMQQALLNLFRNAAEAMSGAGTLTIALEPTARWVRIVVADSGPGISPGSEEAIFAPFFSTKERGTGLGLAVARAAIAAHNGTLSVRPATGGAVFVITLSAADELERGGTHTQGSESNGTNSRRRR